MIKKESENMEIAEQIAKRFHETYEKLAPQFNYKTRKSSAVPWNKVPKDNKNLMIHVVLSLLNDKTIEPTIEFLLDLIGNE